MRTLTQPWQALSRYHGLNNQAQLFLSTRNIAHLPQSQTSQAPPSPFPSPESKTSWTLPHALEVRPASGTKGLGTFATTSIPAFTRIISDAPLLSMSLGEDLPELWTKFQTLTPSQQETCMTLSTKPIPALRESDHDIFLANKLQIRGYPPDQTIQMARTSAIFTANAFNITSDSARPGPHHDATRPTGIARALFPTIARINHSCAPNAHTNYNPLTGRMTVHTLREIPRREEIQIAYFNMLLPRAERQSRAALWGFACACSVCRSGPLQFRQESARARILEIEAKHLALMRGEIRDSEGVKHAVQEVDEMVGVVRSEWSLTPQLPFAYEDGAVARMVAFEATGERGLLEGVMERLMAAVAAECAITGEDGQAVEKRREKVGAFVRALGDMGLREKAA